MLLAQSKPSPAPKTASFKLFFEKVYLHTDRDYYASGDDLWFKAYLVNGESNYPTFTSNNLYVDLVSSESKIISREIIRLDDGMGYGDFKLTDSIPGGIYHLRAYTNWMRNFGDNFIFDKQITVNSIPGIKPVAAVIKKSRKNKAAIAGDDAGNGNKISLFPEGGSMVEGVMGIVGFKAEDALGNGVQVNGTVLSSQGETVGNFASTSLGLGSFALMPVAGVTYHVKGNYKDGTGFDVDLPAALTEGYAMHIKNSDTTNVQVIVSANPATFAKHKGQSLTIASKHADKIVSDGQFVLNNEQTAINIPKAKLPAGVNSILLYDEQKRPNCERLVYINCNNDIRVTVTSDKSSYKPKEKTILNISVVNAQNQPVKANLSLAAVDGNVVPANEGSIASYLLLQADVRGKIENAAQYFDPVNANRFKQLDLLLLTQGWRDFVWKRLADSTLKLSYLPEAGFTISGKLRSVLINKPIPDMNITLFAPGAKGNKMFFTKTDDKGKYFLDNIELYGTQTLHITSRDDKGKKSGWVFLDTIGHDPVPAPQIPVIEQEPSDALAAFNAASKTRQNNARRFRVADGVTLNEVVIKDVHKTIVSYNGETLSTFGYPEYNNTITAADYKYKDLEDYLVHKIPGAQTNNDAAQGIVFHFGGKPVVPRLTVDKKEDIFERLDYYSLSMDQVISVKVDHYVNGAGGDVIYIYLTLKPTAFDKKEFNILNTEVTGYYSARTFYSPNYEYPSNKADQRTTIYWEPMITTDANGKASVSYYNADPKSKIRVVVEGLTEKGVPVVSTSGYNVNQ
ncbi:hypothetical protein BEL04_04120 [Mucilaginibacter sp. PPCGB 2223]|nr:hypothetical protein BEL04_04120 [Mucilaginibacter sp. PPCGB 2223]